MRSDVLVSRAAQVTKFGALTPDQRLCFLVHLGKLRGCLTLQVLGNFIRVRRLHSRFCGGLRRFLFRLVLGISDARRQIVLAGYVLEFNAVLGCDLVKILDNFCAGRNGGWCLFLWHVLFLRSRGG